MHRILWTVTGQTFREVPPGTDRLADLLREPGSRVLQVVTPGTEIRIPPSAVVAWRTQLGTKYAAQLQEGLWWDEESLFTDGEDLASSTIGNLTYIVARATTDGDDAIARLARTPRPNVQQEETAIAAAARRGFSSPYPQLLLGVDVWLPFRRNLILEEPNPLGHTQRFGSLPALLAELASLQSLLLAADPSIAPWGERAEVAEHDLLAASWQAIASLHRKAALAKEQRLPLILQT
ncbi:MAG: hypothetical protein NTY94_06750 [Alphaproteobacteria bacterium]|nr:hypothetical protein [Alphaproteobacteria bacterium]